MRKRRHGWVKPLIDIHCQFAAGDYPLTIKICFENGVTRRYRDDELHQPSPGNYFTPHKQTAVGYRYNYPENEPIRMKKERKKWARLF